MDFLIGSSVDCFTSKAEGSIVLRGISATTGVLITGLTETVFCACTGVTVLGSSVFAITEGTTGFTVLFCVTGTGFCSAGLVMATDFAGSVF